MPCGWEGIRRSGIALAMRHRLQWFIHLWVYSLDMEMRVIWRKWLKRLRCRQATSQVSYTATDGGPLTSANHCRTLSMVWNSLPDDLRAQQDYESFIQGLKTWLFSRY